MALIKETMQLFSLNPRFYDSPLSDKGMKDCQGLKTRLKEAPQISDSVDIKVLRGDDDAPPSVVCSSQLRRAIVTCVVGVWPRLKKNQFEQVHLLSDLQEGSFNVDCVPLSLAGEAPRMDDLKVLKDEGLSSERTDRLFATGLNRGDKPVRWSHKKKGFLRLERFSEWCFSGLEGHTVVAVGHSMWFRKYFQCFLPHNSTHKSKKNKMENGAAVAFDLYHKITDSGHSAYKIDEASIVEVHKGFMAK